MDSPLPGYGATGAALCSRNHLPTAAKPSVREEQKENYKKVKNLLARFTLLFVCWTDSGWCSKIPTFVSLCDACPLMWVGPITWV